MISGPHLSWKLSSPFLFYNPPLRQWQAFQKPRVFKSFHHLAVLAHRDVRPAAECKETVPRFLICAAPGATSAPVPASAQPVKAFLDLRLGGHTVA